ncbi:hypothetical protein SAMN04487948_12554 [Halogranum amylolyticum]|uniref:Uncharacterized protein n=1 Tax=Halogranum amylolyticum TaxID=660520 RepID=A0A1H8W9K6_9EURY|nr:hypothetical protein SAMN04487948_12554 [Halogranum amylolyticum]
MVFDTSRGFTRSGRVVFVSHRETLLGLRSLLGTTAGIYLDAAKNDVQQIEG